MKSAVPVSIGLIAVVLAIAGLTKKEYDRVSSPDGRFVAVAEFPRYEALLTRFPGATGDKSGSITLSTRAGKKIGTISVPMVSSIRDIRWMKEEASIPALATWRLPRE